MNIDLQKVYLSGEVVTAHNLNVGDMLVRHFVGLQISTLFMLLSFEENSNWQMMRLRAIYSTDENIKFGNEYSYVLAMKSACGNIMYWSPLPNFRRISRGIETNK